LFVFLLEIPEDNVGHSLYGLQRKKVGYMYIFPRRSLDLVRDCDLSLEFDMSKRGPATRWRDCNFTKDIFDISPAIKKS